MDHTYFKQVPEISESAREEMQLFHTYFTLQLAEIVCFAVYHPAAITGN